MDVAAPVANVKRALTAAGVKIRTILDNSLKAHKILWAGAGDHNSMFSITYNELLRITQAGELTVR